MFVCLFVYLFVYSFNLFVSFIQPSSHHSSLFFICSHLHAQRHLVTTSLFHYHSYIIQSSPHLITMSVIILRLATSTLSFPAFHCESVSPLFSLSLSLHHSSVGPSLRHSVWASVSPSLSLGVRLSVTQSGRPSLRHSVWASVSPSLSLGVRLSVTQSGRPSLRHSVWASVSPSLSLGVRLFVTQSGCPSLRHSVCYPISRGYVFILPFFIFYFSL